MINIKLQNNYKSIKSLANTTLPDLTILTGLNGSGKSQFLEAIANGPYKIEVPVSGHIDGMYYNFVAVGTVYPNGRVKLNGHAKHYF